jgi:hypothetical protein
MIVWINRAVINVPGAALYVVRSISLLVLLVVVVAVAIGGPPGCQIALIA